MGTEQPSISFPSPPWTWAPRSSRWWTSMSLSLSYVVVWCSLWKMFLTLNLSSMVFKVVDVLMVQVPPSSVTWEQDWWKNQDFTSFEDNALVCSHISVNSKILKFSHPSEGWTQWQPSWAGSWRLAPGKVFSLERFATSKRRLKSWHQTLGNYFLMKSAKVKEIAFLQWEKDYIENIQKGFKIDI